jgi:hypothetical protein
VVRPLRDDFYLWRREIGIRVHGHPLKRHDAAHRDEPGEHQHQKSLPQRRLDDSMNHLVVIVIILKNSKYLYRCR